MSKCMRTPRFTNSKDGIERASIKVTLRFTHEEYAKLKIVAKNREQTISSVVHGIAGLAVENELSEYHVDGTLCNFPHQEE